jgi:hypothetical protein
MELAREVGARGIQTSRGNQIDKKYLYRLVSNRAYIGEAVHKSDSYPGEHDAIIDRETWDHVHGLCCTKPLMSEVPLSPDGFIPRFL